MTDQTPATIPASGRIKSAFGVLANATGTLGMGALAIGTGLFAVGTVLLGAAAVVFGTLGGAAAGAFGGWALGAAMPFIGPAAGVVGAVVGGVCLGAFSFVCSGLVGAFSATGGLPFLKIAEACGRSAEDGANAVMRDLRRAVMPTPADAQAYINERLAIAAAAADAAAKTRAENCAYFNRYAAVQPRTTRYDARYDPAKVDTYRRDTF